MTFDQIFETIPTQGWLTKDEAQLLWEAARATEGEILEVGCYCGRSTALLASLARVVHAVDPLDGFDSDLTGDQVEERLINNLKERNIVNVIRHRCPISYWLPRPIGFAYLDGDHTFKGTLEQISVALSCGARSVCLHDYATSGGGLEVVRAIKQSPIVIEQLVGRMAHCVLP